MRLLLIVLFMASSTTAFSETVTISQKNKAFVVNGELVSELSVTAGSTLRFKNEDSFFHNVFSLSDLIMFDLGSFPQGEFRDVVFDKVGTVEVECAIHPEMMVKVHVK